ncbi:MAG TPA: hypothetical protein VFM19_06755 [Candidatus Limnocylindria bacterium]|nr:hypothetical protein [Candidatus Limnocylindria bacterium]
MIQADTVEEPGGFVRLAASNPLSAEPATVAGLLARGGDAWSGEPVDGAPDGMRRYSIDLRLRVGGERGGLTTFRKAALLDIGVPRQAGDGWVIDVGWRAATVAPLFPVFAGRLIVTPGQLRLDGVYAPPGGIVGRVADRVLLHVAANGTARWLLGELARAAEAPTV